MEGYPAPASPVLKLFLKLMRDTASLRITRATSTIGYAVITEITEDAMTGRLIPCIGQDGEFASDPASRQAACKWLGDLLEEGKRWSEARSEIAHYYTAAGLEERIAHAKSKGAKDLIKPWLQGLVVSRVVAARPQKKTQKPRKKKG
jgi:hypothetical protein